MTDLGEAYWALNMEITRDCLAKVICLEQGQYAESILERHGVASCCLVSTPMAASLHLPKLDEAEIDLKPYQSALGLVMYAWDSSRLGICSGRA